MDALIPRYCLSLLLLTSIARSAGSNETNDEELREPRVTGRIVKLYSGAKPEPYLCTGEGFQADPSSCAAFYRCVKERSGKFTVFRYQCAPGTVYDPDVETCNHPRSTRRTDCGGMLKPTSDPSHTANINEIDGAQSEIPRPISTKVPIYTEQTISKIPTTLSWILSTERQNQTKTPWPSTSTTKLPDSTTNSQWLYSTQHHWESQYTSKPPSKTAQSLNTISTESCTSDGFMGDSENCQKFYRCVGNQRGGYVKYEFSCSESTVWDDEIQGCNHPWAVKRSKCGRSLSYDDRSTSHKQDLSWTKESTTKSTTLSNGEFGDKSNMTIQHQLQISHGSKATQTQTQISDSPNVIQNQTQINYGDRVQNNTYSKYKQNQTQINYGTAVSQTQTQIDYGNKGMQTQLQIDHSKDFSQSQIQIVDGTTQSTTSSPANNNGKYECTESGFIGDANDCKKFYRCVNNGRGYTKYEYSCGDGTVWDPEIEACNHAWAVKECGAKHSGSSTTETYTTKTEKSTENPIEHTKTTLSYTTSQIPDIDDEDDVGYGNQNNQEVASSSTTTIKTTTTTAKSTTQKPSGAATECTISGFMGDANDCKVFYRCVDNGNSGFIKHEFKCGDGTVWDPDIEACNHVWAVEKCGGSTSSNADKEDATTKKDNTTPAENVHTTITLIQITTQAPTKGDDYDTGYGSQQHEPSTTVTPNTPTNKPISPPQDKGTNNNTICKSSGFVGDENDCKKFFRCVDNGNGGYIKYEFTCGQGTVWDPKIDVCNYAWAVEKCGGSNHINESNSYETTSQLSSTTGSGDLASIQTTQVSKETNNSMKTTSTTSSSTTDSGISNKCSNSGFMGDTKNCKKFYRCVDNGDRNFIRYEFTCGEGTVWDPKIEACNHAWAVEKCGGSEDSGVTREPQQTTLQYPVMQDEYQDNGYVTPNETSNTPQSTVATTSATTKKHQGIKSTCNSEGFYANPSDCKKFYRCVAKSGNGGYTKYDFNCGEGTAWNQEIQACDHESSDKSCSTSSTTQSQTTESHSESTSYSSTTKNQETTHKTDISESMGSQCKSEGFFAHPNDCKKFIRCVDNGNGGYIRYEFSCGDGTVWVQEIQACDHDNDVNSCILQVRPTTQVSNTESNPPSSSSSSSVTFSTESMPSNDEYDTQILNEPLHDETDDCTSEGYFANKQDCRKFYRCVDNGKGGYTKYNFACGEGTAWDSDGQTCNYINNVQSCSRPNQAENGNRQTTTNKNKAEPEGTSSTTKASTSTGTSESSNSQDICESEGYFGDSTDCKKFYRCVDNGKGGYTKYDYTCGEGTIWDQDITTCNHPQDVSNPSCSSSQGSSDTSSTTSSTTSSSQTTSSTSQGSSSSQSTSDYSQESSKKPGNNNVTCDKAGYFGNSNDSKKFYRCVDWDGDGKRFSVFHFECGEGTIWDPALDTCNHEDSVYPQRDCSTQSQNVAGETSTTEKSTTTTEESTTSEQTTQESTTAQQTTSEKTTTEQSNEPTTTQETTSSENTITQESTTSEQTTTQQTTTSEKTTTPEPTTSVQTTTQQPATSEQTTIPQSTTTEQSSTSEQTTNEQSTTSEQTTTQQTTTSEASTTQQSTTSEQTTTQQTTTSEQTTISEQTTTQQSATSEETTTQQAITSEQTTTQQSTISEQTTINEQTTTQQSITSEQTTTQQSTTSEQTTINEQTTTQQSTNGEQTTTQQSTTSEQTTTQQSTPSDQTTISEQTTTQPSTTSEQTTTPQSTTSEQATTQQSTTEQTTTQESTPSYTTTQESSTSEQTTTQQSTTSEQTTTEPSSTSEQTTIQQSTTSEQTTPQQSTTSEQTTPQQSTTSEQTTPQQSTTSEASAIQQTTTNEQTTTQQSTTSEQTTSTEQSSTTTELATDGTTTTDNTTDGTTTEETINQSTTETSNTESDSTEDTSSTTEESSSDDKECPKTEDDQYLLVCPTSFKRHPKYCNMFYQCIEDDETYEAKVAMFKCPNNTIYDETQIQCVTEDKADKKCDGEIANKRRFKRLGSNYKEPIVANKGDQSCSSTGYFSFEKHSECAKGFLKCEKSKNGGLRGYVYQCPDGYVYWSISKRCERIENISDCKKSSNDWTGRWNIPVERKNVAYS